MSHYQTELDEMENDPRNDWSDLRDIAALFGVAVAFLALWLFVYTAHDPTPSLIAAGYHDIKIGGYAVLSCGRGDTFPSHFEATAADGQRVKGVVCCGILKGCTVRF